LAFHPSLKAQLCSEHEIAVHDIKNVDHGQMAVTVEYTDLGGSNPARYL